MGHIYRILNHNQHYIDKTKLLEKGIEVFPSIYIEGAAACGKTTAVKMLLTNHQDVDCFVFDMKKYRSEESLFERELEKCSVRMSERPCWAIFENLQQNQSYKLSESIANFINVLPKGGRALLVSREKPPVVFLDLLWKQQMIQYKQHVFLFSRDEIREFIEHVGCKMDAEDIYTKTGGWAGCVSLMINMAAVDERTVGIPKTAADYLGCYEMQTYIKQEILDSLGSDENIMIDRASKCPWINEKMCREIWHMVQPEKVLDSLTCKGLLVYDQAKEQWRLAPMIYFSQKVSAGKEIINDYEKSEITGQDSSDCTNDKNENQDEGIGRQLGDWYDQNGYIREAVKCYKNIGDEKRSLRCMINHFSEIPYSDIDFKDVMLLPGNLPEICYLRGMYCYMHRDFNGLEREIKKMTYEADKGWIYWEVYMNLMFVSPKVTLEEWLRLLESRKTSGKKLRLYQIFGSSPIALCGVRDLSGLFACSLKEEKRMARLWKECLIDEAWEAYQMARMDFYMETLRSDIIDDKDRELLNESPAYDHSRQKQLAGLYLQCKYQGIHPDESNQKRTNAVEEKLMAQENRNFRNMTAAVVGLFALQQGESEKLVRWVRYSDFQTIREISEDNFTMFCFLSKCFLLLNQYDKTKKLLVHLIPYAKVYKRDRLTAELLFQSAIVSFNEENQGQMLRSVIESFLICGSSHYVNFYTGYGTNGLAVIKSYMEWMQNSAPEGWHRKKKYNYGNVLRMPKEDYMETVLRCARREARVHPNDQDMAREEKLTMTETLVLQNIGRGLSNAEICSELNLKMATVKSHVYSIYKKLGVSSRVQAVLKGKELGILR